MDNLEVKLTAASSPVRRGSVPVSSGCSLAAAAALRRAVAAAAVALKKAAIASSFLSHPSLLSRPPQAGPAAVGLCPDPWPSTPDPSSLGSSSGYSASGQIWSSGALELAVVPGSSWWCGSWSRGLREGGLFMHPPPLKPTRVFFFIRRGGVYDDSYVQKVIDRADAVEQSGEKLSGSLPASGMDDISVLAMQRLNDHQPNGPATPVDMVVDYFKYDFELAEPPRTLSLQNTVPNPTFVDYGEDEYFVADQRGYETVVYYLAGQFLKTDGSGKIIDPRLKLNKVVREISYSSSGVTVRTEDKSVYSADYVMVSTSLGVLQTDLIQFKPKLPAWKLLVIYQFDMVIYTKIFLKFPKKFWPEGKGREFFLYASSRRGYYAAWQALGKQYPDANVLMVTVTDEESRRIEQQSDNQTKAEIMQVVRKMFPGAPDATDILVPRWWSDRFYKGTYSNWPIGVNRYEFDQLRAPVGRVYFTGEHTSENYTGYVHGAYLSGIDSAEILINCAQKKMCKYNVKGKYD